MAGGLRVWRLWWRFRWEASDGGREGGERGTTSPAAVPARCSRAVKQSLTGGLNERRGELRLVRLDGNGEIRSLH
jgi:hypothetical protein